MTTDHDPQKAMADALEAAKSDLYEGMNKIVRQYEERGNGSFAGTDEVFQHLKTAADKIDAALAYRAQAEEPKWPRYHKRHDNGALMEIHEDLSGRILYTHEWETRGRGWFEYDYERESVQLSTEEANTLIVERTSPRRPITTEGTR